MKYTYIKIENGEVVEKSEFPPLPFEKEIHLGTDFKPENAGWYCISSGPDLSRVKIKK